jgi:[ribosomal protein S18]-alanine N-acetyltransferase
MIYPLTPSDAHSLSQLHRECFSDGWSEGTFSGFLNDSSSCGYKTTDSNGTITGFILARTIAQESEILTIAVRSTHQNQGLGTRLVAALQELVEESQVTKIHLEVAMNNPAAISLYTKSGFEKTGFRPDYYHLPPASPVSALIMTWTSQILVTKDIISANNKKKVVAL